VAAIQQLLLDKENADRLGRVVDPPSRYSQMRSRIVRGKYSMVDTIAIVLVEVG